MAVDATRFPFPLADRLESACTAWSNARISCSRNGSLSEEKADKFFVAVPSALSNSLRMRSCWAVPEAFRKWAHNVSLQVLYSFHHARTSAPAEVCLIS